MASIKIIDNEKAYATIYTGERDLKGQKKRKRFTIYNEKGLGIKAFKTFCEKQAQKEEEKAQARFGGSGTVKVKEFAIRYFKDVKEKEKFAINTLTGKVHDYNNYILERWGDYQLLELKTSEIQGWVDTLSAEKSYSHMKRIFFCFSGILDEAARLELVDTNPCKKVELIKTKKQKNQEKKVKAFTIKEIEYYKSKIDELESPMQRVVFYLAIYCGLRIGEILGLTWECVDFKKSELKVELQRTHNEDVGWITSEPKTFSGKRTVYLPKKIHPLLKEWRTLQELESKLYNYQRVRYEDRGELNLVATNKYGLSPARGTFNRWLLKWNTEYNENARKLAKSEDREPELFEYKSFHSFRHYYASNLVNNKISLEVARDMLGHKDIKTTFDTYVDAFDEKVKEELKALFDKEGN